MTKLRLTKAPASEADRSLERFREFIEANPNPFVTLRSEDVIRSAIADESLFFVEEESGKIAATTGFYRHGTEELWGEIGSTLVSKKYQGAGLQGIMYRHIISLKKMSDWPTELIAVVSEGASYSYRNIERCGFARLNSIPDALIAATPHHDWESVRKKAKRLYRLSTSGLVNCLLYVADVGSIQTLTNREGLKKFSLSIDFAYLKEPDARAALIEVAQASRQQRCREM